MTDRTGRRGPRAVLAASALFLGLVGFLLMLAPDELGAWLGILPAPGAASGGTGAAQALQGTTAGVELFGAALFSVGFMDWLARGAIYGGIYGRPIALGNFLLGLLAATVLLREASRLPGHVLSALFAVHAAAFGWILFRARPWERGGPAEPGAG